ncbi:hypothetical protein LP419_36640 [Massilia sp. H-1]|nr:hypothetical protein LP419_36640 [Massilia sp. H-1]
MADQIRLGKLLDAPTPVQYFLVRGDSPETVLQREEALKQRLDVLVAMLTASPATRRCRTGCRRCRCKPRAAHWCKTRCCATAARCRRSPPNSVKTSSGWSPPASTSNRTPKR